MTVITLNQNYGYTPYSISKLPAGSVIDATNATWIVDNSSIDFPDATHSTTSGTGALNTYPFKVDGAGPGLLIEGGAIWGQVPQQSDWQYTYNNSAAIRVANAPGVIIDDWRLDSTWDAIRIASGATNFLIDDTWITNVRDDAVEDDDVLGGTIRDSLFDGVFSGISLGDSEHVDGSMNTVTLDGLMMRMKSYLFEGTVTHETPFKCDTGAPGTTPDIRIDNSVIAIEDVNHAGQKRLQIAWDHVVESHGNVFLNLSDVPLPSTYPKPPAGFTILQGQQARDYWEACKAAWHANHDGVNDAGVTALPPLPGSSPSTPPPPVVATHDAAGDFNGDGRSDILWRNDNGALTDWLGTTAGGFSPNGTNLLEVVDSGWQIAGIGDFNGDSRDDVLWRRADGAMTDWLGTASGGLSPNGANLLEVVSPDWQIAAVGDINGDTRDDILWRRGDGALTDWLGNANGSFTPNAANLLNVVSTDWHVIGLGDFNGDNKADLLWRNDDGRITDWLGTATGGFSDNLANAYNSISLDWQIVGIGDFNGDHRDDILLRNADGRITDWLGNANGGFTPNSGNFYTSLGTDWSVASTGDFNGDHRDDILFRNADGRMNDWLGTATGAFTDNLPNAFQAVDTHWHVQPHMALV